MQLCSGASTVQSVLMVAPNDDKAVRIFNEESEQKQKNLTGVRTWQAKAGYSEQRFHHLESDQKLSMGSSCRPLSAMSPLKMYLAS